MKIKWKIEIFAVVFAALVIYNLPYFEEMRVYDKVKEGKELSLCNSYLKEYPDGRHLDDVLYMKIGLSNNEMPVIVSYLTKCPDGNHSAEVNALCDKLWNEEITKYNRRDKQKESTVAVKYMSQMLQYMKTHRVNYIQVNINSVLKLKDYTEYDEKIRKLLEFYSNDESSISLPKDMISIKENFTQADNSYIEQILIEGVQKSINKMFTPNFILAVPESRGARKDVPQLSFDYVIESQEDNMGKYKIPHIWTYTENGVAKAYILGISINFKAHFSIPGSVMTYDYAEKGEPENEIGNIQDVKDGYRRMTYICVERFSNKMSENMGLEQTYIRGN